MSHPIPRNEISAVVLGRTLRDAHCEKCGVNYVYVLSRQAEGKGSTSVFSTIEKAEQIASKVANDALSAELRESVDPVPCPNCGWLQTAMVQHLHARNALWSTALAGLAVFFSGCGLVLSAALALLNWQMNNRELSSFVQKVVVVSLILGVGGVAVLLVDRWRTGRWDPNDCDRVQQAARGRKLAVIKHENAIADLAAMLAVADEEQQRERERLHRNAARSKAIWAAAFALISLGFLASQVSPMKAAVESYLWGSANGKLTAAHVETGRRGKHQYYWPDVEYDYSVDGQAFHGSRYGLETDDSLFKSTAERIVRHLRSHPDVVVYYDARDPAASVLSRGLAWWRAVIIAMFLPLGGSSAVLAWKSWRRRRQEPW